MTRGLSPGPPDPEFEVVAPLPYTPPLGSPKYLFLDSDIMARKMVKYSWTIIGWNFVTSNSYFIIHYYCPTEHTPSLTLPSEIIQCACKLQISQLSARRKLTNQSCRLRWFPELTVGSLVNEKTDDECILKRISGSRLRRACWPLPSLSQNFKIHWHARMHWSGAPNEEIVQNHLT